MLNRDSAYERFSPDNPGMSTRDQGSRTPGSRPGNAERAVREPSRGEFLIRLGIEAIQIAFIIAIKWALTKWLRYTHLEGEWWAQILMWAAAAYAVIGFVVIAGAELYAACATAVKSAWRRVREE